jgi:hypothetical protein
MTGKAALLFSLALITSAVHAVDLPPPSAPRLLLSRIASALSSAARRSHPAPAIQCTREELPLDRSLWFYLVLARLTEPSQRAWPPAIGCSR